RWLRGRGVGRGDCVGLLLPRGPEVYVALLAILKAGAAYVPLDPDYPADRVGFILKDCRAQSLITSSALAGRHDGFTGQLVALDAIQAELAGAADDPLPGGMTGVTPDDLCYVI